MSETDSYKKVLRVAELNEATIHVNLGQLLQNKDLEIITSNSEDAVDIRISSKTKKGEEALLYAFSISVQKCEFANQSHLSLVFKCHLGFIPQAYRWDYQI